MNNHSLCPGRPGRHWRHDPDQPDLAASMPLPSASRRQPDVPLNQEAHDDRPEKVPPSQTDVFLDPSPLSYAIVQAHAWMVAHTVHLLSDYAIENQDDREPGAALTLPHMARDVGWSLRK